MPDETVKPAETPVVAPPVAAKATEDLLAPSPGKDSSEYSVTKITLILTTIASVVGVATDLLQSLSTAMPGSKWIGPALTIAGLIGSVLAALGYQVTRAQVKVAAHNAAGVAAAGATEAAADIAAGNLGKA